MCRNLTKLKVGLRIAIVQLNPQIGQVDQTVSRAWELLSKLREKATRAPDIIVFPEFALTGYNFHTKDEIKPYLSTQDEGVSAQLAKAVSKKFGCFTVIGYPEQTKTGELYNSALVVNPSGKVVFNYRKSFLYDTDEEWGCRENPAKFQTFTLPFEAKATDPQGKVRDVDLITSIGICMDLNPYKFKAPFNSFEFSSFNLDHSSELIICPMAWLHSSSVTSTTPDREEARGKITRVLEEQGLPIHGSQGKFQVDLGPNNATARIASDDEEIDESYTKMDEPDMKNVNYWILRFLPFLGIGLRNSWFAEKVLFPLLSRSKLENSSFLGSSLNRAWSFEDKNAVLVLANRCGVEEGTTVFAGSSGIYKFNGQCTSNEAALDSTNKSVDLLGNLGKGLEGIIMRDIEFEVERELD